MHTAQTHSDSAATTTGWATYPLAASAPIVKPAVKAVGAASAGAGSEYVFLGSNRRVSNRVYGVHGAE